jgi:hypothetical protein
VDARLSGTAGTSLGCLCSDRLSSICIASHKHEFGVTEVVVRSQEQLRVRRKCKSQTHKRSIAAGFTIP